MLRLRSASAVGRCSLMSASRMRRYLVLISLFLRLKIRPFADAPRDHQRDAAVSARAARPGRAAHDQTAAHQLARRPPWHFPLRHAAQTR